MQGRRYVNYTRVGEREEEKAKRKWSGERDEINEEEDVTKEKRTARKRYERNGVEIRGMEWRYEK